MGSGSSSTTDPWIGSYPFPPHQHTVIFCLPNPCPTPIQIYLYLPFLFLGSDVSPYGVLTGTKCYCERPVFASFLGCWQQRDKSFEYLEGPDFIPLAYTWPQSDGCEVHRESTKSPKVEEFNRWRAWLGWTSVGTMVEAHSGFQTVVCARITPGTSQGCRVGTPLSRFWFWRGMSPGICFQ